MTFSLSNHRTQSHATKLLLYILAGVFVTHHQQSQSLLPCHLSSNHSRQFVQFDLDFDYYFSFESFRVLLNIPERLLVITPSSRGATMAIAAIARKNVSLLRVPHVSLNAHFYDWNCGFCIHACKSSPTTVSDEMASPMHSMTLNRCAGTRINESPNDKSNIASIERAQKHPHQRHASPADLQKIRHKTRA